MTAESELKAYAELVDSRLDVLIRLPDGRPAALESAMRYSALAPGKRIRPALVMACAEAAGGDPLTTLDAACAVEMVHAFSLIHDDLPALDDDELRRGRATCHVKFGEAVAILAGDALFALAFQTVLGPNPDAQSAQAAVELSRAATQLVAGETEDLLAEGEPLDDQRLDFIHLNKTAALIAAACRIGAIGTGAPASTVEALGRYGEHIGIAFQIADDILNETSSPEQLGKATGSDRERGKTTYPAVHGLEAARRHAVAQADLGIAALAEVPGPTDRLVALARFSVERLR